ncbi:hypothetical protein CGLAUT_04580 [Corynebacterium glaucum]|uniref:DUF418 domain-containing protein n=1 Tax=Corynebacterium glaucum TaxID=187491 RepID=UPI0025B48569|nr:DUF418 domain-containing protein [Corynebacterium glaucum]WJZ07414.1 hypothetical protein CGLAUT_04580 [Corynebacterium glaucum]
MQMPMEKPVTNRVIGVDVARAVALIGMMVAHLTYSDGIAAEVVYGFPSALFALLAGVSMGFMAGRGARPVHFIVRGVILIALHLALLPFAGSIYVVLGTLGICMIALAWAPRWGRRVIAGVIAACTVVSGLVWQFDDGTLWPISEPYPVFMWAALMLAGMLTQRYIIGHTRRCVVAAALGPVAMALTILARWYMYLPWFFDAEGHTGGVIDVVGSAGAAIGMCALCCLAAQPWQRVLPRMGAMPLTLYCLHVVTADYVGLWITLAVAAVLATVWLQFFRRGPVEAAVRRLVASGAGAIEKRAMKEGKKNEAASIHPGGGHVGDGGYGGHELPARIGNGEHDLRR